MPTSLTYPAFLVRLTGVAGVLAGVSYFLLQATAPQAVGVALLALGVSWLVTALVFRISSGGLQGTATQFMGGILGGMGLKVICSLGLVAVLALRYKPLLVPVLLVYFSGHVVFTSFEVWALLNNLRANQKTALPPTP
jgi:hypothetical protein